MKDQKPKKQITTIRLDVELLKKLKGKAHAEGRSFNNFIERILVKI